MTPGTLFHKACGNSAIAESLRKVYATLTEILRRIRQRYPDVVYIGGVK
jgi:hypothetical protein